MILEIAPYVSAGPVQLGMSRADIHKLFENPPRPFLIDPASPVETDVYDGLGLFVFYNPAYYCTAIEVYRPNVAVFAGQDLLNLSLKQAVMLFKDNLALHVDEVGYRSYQHGIAGYYESKRRPENVVVFSPDYYPAP